MDICMHGACVHAAPLSPCTHLVTGPRSPVGGLDWHFSVPWSGRQPTDVSVASLSLQLCGSAAGRTWPDLRLNLLRIQTGAASQQASGRVRPAAAGGLLSPAHACTVRHALSMSAAGAVAFVMAPDTMGPLLRAAAVPGIAGLVAPALLHFRHVRRWRLVRAGRRITREVCRKSRRARIQSSKLQWALKAGQGVSRAAQAVAGGAALLWCACKLAWQLAPGAMNVASAMLGLCSVMMEYNVLGARVRRGDILPGVCCLLWHDETHDILWMCCRP